MTDSPRNPLLLLITGSRGAGKTSLCRQLVEAAREAGWQAAGVLSNPVFDGQTRTAIQAENLRDGETRILATRSDAPTPGSQHWRFDDAALDWGNAVFQASTPCDLLVVDELGPLELERGAGWLAALAAIDSRQYAVALVVVRSELLGEVLLRWDDAYLVEVETPHESQRKAEALAEQLF